MFAFKIRHCIALVLCACLIVAHPHDAFAKKKSKKNKNKGISVSEADYFTVKISLGNKKGQSVTIKCFNDLPGIVKSTPAGQIFMAFKKLKKTAKGDKKKAKYKTYAKLGAQACLSPDFLSLDEYKGTFGPAEARLLFDRFAFGASPEQINLAVAEGLNKTVQRLTTYQDEPALDAIEKDIQCDGKLPSDPENSTCDPTDPDDLSLPGVRNGLLYKMYYTVNPYFEKMFMFLHDERLSISSSKLGGSTAHAIYHYLNAVRNAARTGDYKKYMQDLNDDLFMRFIWLDGAYPGINPNENWPREFWELGTVGPTDLNGHPVYSSLDIANSALAMSGWDIDCSSDSGHWTCNQTYTPVDHATGQKVIFAGTPYQAVINNPIGLLEANDVLEATFQHPRTSESLAEDLWKEFINPFASPSAIKSLAKVIRDNGFNLLTTTRQIMKSRAMFAQKSRKSIIKQPVDALFGFIRQTGIPLDYYYIDSELNALRQLPLKAPTVFGWNEVSLADESRVLDWRNFIIMMIAQSNEDLAEQNYDLHAKFLSDQPSINTLIHRVADWLNVSLNQDQVSEFVQYLNYDLEPCNWGHQQACASGLSYKGEGEFFLDKNLYDPDIASDNWWKVRGLIAIISMLPEYRMK